MEESGAQYEQVKRLEELENANQRLSEQVKRLLKTEHELYHTQEQLDTQIRLYRQLYEVGNRFNATFDLVEILRIATEFVLYELNFERCLVLLRSEGAKDFCVQALDGYYRSESFAEVDEISAEIGRRTERCLESLGKFAALRYELAERVGVAASSDALGETVVAEIGPRKITQAELDRMVETQIERQLSPLASYLPDQERRKQKETMLQQVSTSAQRLQFLNQFVLQEILSREVRVHH